MGLPLPHAHHLFTERGKAFGTWAGFGGAERAAPGRLGKNRNMLLNCRKCAGSRGPGGEGTLQGLGAMDSCLLLAVPFPGQPVRGWELCWLNPVRTSPTFPSLSALSSCFASPFSRTQCPHASGNHMSQSLGDNSDLKHSHPTSDHVSLCCSCPRACRPEGWWPTQSPTLETKGGWHSG